MLDDFPSTHGDKREELILDIVKNQQDRVHISWSTLTLQEGGHTGTFFVMNDALKVDNIRVNVTAKTQQLIADHLACVLLTAKLCDNIWDKCEIRIVPCPQSITSATSAMISHSERVEKQIDEEDRAKLISTVGKHWILDAKMASPRLPNQAINYGWHFAGNSFQGISGGVNASLLKAPSGQYWKMIQTIGTHHDAAHVDYSQICRLASRQCIIDGKQLDLLEVYQDKELASLVSHTGALPIVRQPGASASNIEYVSGGIYEV